MAVAFKTALGTGLATTSGTTIVITTTAAIAIGDLVVVRWASDNLNATTPTATCADGGNTYTVLRQAAVNATAAAGVAGGMLATKATVARPTSSTITVTLSGTVAGHKCVIAESFTGVENTTRVAAVGATGTATGASAGATAAGVLTGDLVLGHIANETRGTITGDTDTTNGSWSTQVSHRSATSGSDATCVSVAGQYKIPTAGGAETYNVTAVAAEWVCQCVVLQASPEPSITQAAYRWYEEGTESGAVPYVAQDTAVVGDISNGDATGTLRIRLQSTTAVAVPATDDFQLQYEKNISGTWINVSAVTTNVSTYDSPNLTNAAATTNRLTGGTGSFVAGKVSEDSLMDDFGWAGNNYTELVYALKVKAADVANGDTLRFRVLRNGATTDMTYSVTPTIDIVQTFAYNETNLPVGLATAVFTEIDQADFKEPNLAITAVTTVAVTDTLTLAPPPLIQEGFRWRNDDGSEVAATWKAAQDTNASLEVGQAARLRLVLDTTTDYTSAPTLYYKKSTDSTWLPVPVGSGGGDPVYVATSSNIAAGGEATTALLTPPSGVTSFSVGRMWDDENGTDTIEIVSGFSPSQVTGLAGWYDASDISTFTFTTGSQMSEWRDKSPNGYHLTTDNHANLTRTGNINGLTCVLSDHGGVEMIGRRTNVDLLSLVDPVNKTDCMNFFVVKLNALGGMGLSMRNASQRVSNDFYQFGGGFWDCVDVTGGRLNHGYTFSLNTPYLLAGYRNGTNMAVYLNGVQIASKSDAGTTAAVSEVGTLKFPSGTNNGNVGEGIHVARYDAADFTAIEDYLFTKWGMPIPPTPTRISGLQAWYDASDGSTFSYSSGSVVSQWSDKSGNGRHLTQATVANQPTRNGVQNGLASVTFDGVNDYIDTASFTVSQPITVCFMENLANVGTQGHFASVGGSFQCWSGAVTDMGMYAGTVAQPNVTTVAGAHTWTTVFNGASSSVYKDGVLIQSGFSVGTSGTTTGLRIGNDRQLAGSPLNGTSCELIVYNRILSTTERQAIETYLKNKWATP